MAAIALSVKEFFKNIWCLDTAFGATVACCMFALMLALFVGCESVSSVGVTGSYGNETVSVGVVITFKESPSAETVAALEAANAVRIKSKPQEVWALGRYSIDNKPQVKAVDAAIKDGGVIERIE